MAETIKQNYLLPAIISISLGALWSFGWIFYMIVGTKPTSYGMIIAGLIVGAVLIAIGVAAWVTKGIISVRFILMALLGSVVTTGVLFGLWYGIGTLLVILN